MRYHSNPSRSGREAAHLLIVKLSPRELHVAILECPAALAPPAERIRERLDALAPWPGPGVLNLFIEADGKRRWLPEPGRRGSMSYLLGWQAQAERALREADGMPPDRPATG